MNDTRLVNSFLKYRSRRPIRRSKFPRKGKPRSSGISIRKEKPFCLPRNTRTQAAAGQPSGRRYNRLPEWTDPRSYITKGGRHRLFGEDMAALRLAAFNRSSQRNGLPMCEDGCGKLAHWTSYPGPYAGELAHNEHGARKSDELDRVKWMRHECHMKSHNCGGKPCPKKVQA